VLLDTIRNVGAEDFLNSLRESTIVTVPAILEGDCHTVMMMMEKA
jgi:hypothetical protein